LHFGFTGLRFSQSGLLLLLKESFFSYDLFFCFDRCGSLDSLQIVLGDDHSIVLVIFFSFTPDGTKLIHRDDGGTSLAGAGGSSAWLLSSE